MRNKMKNTNQIKRTKMKNKNRKTGKNKKKETFDENWMTPKKKPNILEKIKMSSVALERLILVSTNNHVYSFKGINRVQKSGMPTGLSETGYLADLFMLWWDKKFIELLESVSLSCDLCVRLKDDGNIIMDKITNVPEEVWNIIDRNKLKFDIENPNFTANLIFELANKVHDMIDFTFDTPHMNADGKLPILDVKVHLTPKNTLVHEFYEKPTRNLKVILAESA